MSGIPDSAPGTLETHADASRAVAVLAERERALEALAAEVSGLEVERIEAELRLEALPAPPGLDRSAAARLAEALDREGRLLGPVEGAPVPRGASEAERRELARLRAGQDALRQWLDAPERVPRRAVPAVARHVLGVAMALAVLAAVLVHPVFLVVLIPVAIPFAFLGLSRQDADWLRLGAARHYQETGLRPPGAWEEGAVRERAEALAAEAGDLEARMRRKDAAAMPAAEPPEEADEAALAVALLEAREEAEAALAAARVSRADAEGPLGDYLEALARLRGIEQALARLRARRRSLEREAEDLRGRVLAWLGRHGTVPPHGAADAGHLAEALEEAAAPRSGV